MTLYHNSSPSTRQIKGRVPRDLLVLFFCKYLHQVPLEVLLSVLIFLLQVFAEIFDKMLA